MTNNPRPIFSISVTSYRPSWRVRLAARLNALACLLAKIGGEA